MNRPTKYILVGHDVKPAPLLRWAEWFEGADRRVLVTSRYGITISTVFLGIDYNFSDTGPPLVFETMVFGGKWDGVLFRYPAWDKAVSGHKTISAIVLRRDKNPRLAKKARDRRRSLSPCGRLRAVRIKRREKRHLVEAIVAKNLFWMYSGAFCRLMEKEARTPLERHLALEYFHHFNKAILTTTRWGRLHRKRVVNTAGA